MNMTFLRQKSLQGGDMTGRGRRNHTRQATQRFLCNGNGGDAMLGEYNGASIDTEAAANMPRCGQDSSFSRPSAYSLGFPIHQS